MRQRFRDHSFCSRFAIISAPAAANPASLCALAMRVRVGRPLYHASENSSHPILLGHSWPPSISSVQIQSLSVGLARAAEGPQPIPPGVSHRPRPHSRQSAAHPHSSSRVIETALASDSESGIIQLEFQVHLSCIGKQKSSNSAGSQLAAQSIQSSRSSVGLARTAEGPQPSESATQSILLCLGPIRSS